MLSTYNIFKGIFSIILIYLLFIAYVAHNKNDFIFQPYDIESTEPNIQFFKTVDNIKIEYMETIRNKDSIVLYFPDNKEDISRTQHLLINDLNKSSMYSFNYRGFGKSEGIATEFDLKKDSLEIFDFIKNKYPTAKITIIGKGLGSSIANYVATKKDFYQLILISPYDNYSSVLQTEYPLIPFYFIDNNIFNNLSSSDNITEKTTLFYIINSNEIPNKNTMNFRLRSGNNDMVIIELALKDSMLYFEKTFGKELEKLLK